MAWPQGWRDSCGQSVRTFAGRTSEQSCRTGAFSALGCAPPLLKRKPYYRTRASKHLIISFAPAGPRRFSGKFAHDFQQSLSAFHHLDLQPIKMSSFFRLGRSDVLIKEACVYGGVVGRE